MSASNQGLDTRRKFEDATIRPARAREQYAQRTFIASGRQVPRTGGVILARAASKEALAAIMAKDPFCARGVATFEIIEFRTSQHDPAFAPFADADARPA